MRRGLHRVLGLLLDGCGICARMLLMHVLERKEERQHVGILEARQPVSICTFVSVKHVN
jgi:hypothetical protein